MRISNEDIIQSAKRQRQLVDSRMSIEKWQAPRRRSRGLVAAMGIAASLISFFAGFALHANMPIANMPIADMSTANSQQLTANSLKIQHDTIMQVQTVRDTIYQTRIVTKYEKPMLAESESTPPEQKACSMLCDDIPYELLATGR